MYIFKKQIVGSNLFAKTNLWFTIGFILTAALTFSEVARGRQYNFMIFSDATRDFWNGIIPYGAAWAEEKGHDVFLYGPLFNILFSPFAYLPSWLAPFVWNLMNFTLYFISIFTLPDKYTKETKCKIFLYTLPILATTLLSFQYNVSVAYFFLFSFSLLERGKYLPAILIILLSGFTKIYGVFQLGMLLFYPKVWKNFGCVALIAALYVFIPLIKIPVMELSGYYEHWFNGLAHQKTLRVFHTFFYLKPFFSQPPAWTTIAQIFAIVLLAFLVLVNRSKYKDFAFRVQALGILMGWVILFGTSSEYHTYVIALLGYMLWYYSRQPSRIDKILYYSNLIVLGLMPIDLFCPGVVWRFFFLTTTLNIWIFTITWFRMVWITFCSSFVFATLLPYLRPSKR